MFSRKESKVIVVEYDIEKVFYALIKGAESIYGFEIRYVTEVTHSVGINVRASLFTWGELVCASLNKLDDGKTEILVKSESKLGTEIFARSKNRENIAKLMEAMYLFLK